MLGEGLKVLVNLVGIVRAARRRDGSLGNGRELLDQDVRALEVIAAREGRDEQAKRGGEDGEGNQRADVVRHENLREMKDAAKAKAGDTTRLVKASGFS